MSDHHGPDHLRVEVVANRAVQEDFFEAIEARGITSHYTLWPEVQGAGDAGPRRGDHIWPEENFVFVSYLSRENALQLRDAVEAVREMFPDEGIRLFASVAVDI